MAQSELSLTDAAALVQASFDRLIDGAPASSLHGVLAPDATWAECSGRDEIIAWIDQADIGSLTDAAMTIVEADDRLIGSLAVDGATVFDVAIFVRAGLIAEIRPATSAAHARSLSPVGPLDETAARPVSLKRLAPVLPVSSIDAALVHYERLGFEVEGYDGAAYGYARRGDVELHLTQVSDLDPKTTTSAVYLFCDDADALYAQWRNAGVEGRFIAPMDTDYGLREGAHLDPDNNLVRFGS